MGPGPWRWTQINQGELGGSFGVHFWVLDPFRGLLRAQKPKMRPIFGNIWTFPDPPAKLVKFFWSKMACTGVPHIVLHVSCLTRTSGGYFWPSEVRFRGILALSRD